MLSELVRTDVRRHLGYPAARISRAAAGSLGQFNNFANMQNLSDLETCLDSLTGIAEAQLTGECVGVIAMVGGEPSPGSTIQLTIASDDLDAPLTLLLTVQDGDDKITCIRKLVSAFVKFPNLVNAGFYATGPDSGGPTGQPELPQMQIKNKNPFSISLSFTGDIAASILSQGVHIDPQAVVGRDLGMNVIKYGFLPILNHLDGAIAGVTQNADVARAGEYVRGPELYERKKLYAIWQSKLSVFLGIPIFGYGHGGGFVI